MASTIFPVFLAALLQLTPVELTVVTVPSNSRVDIPLVPSGEVEARREPTLTDLRIRLDRIDPLSSFGASMPAYVAWAVSPEGEFENLGELRINGRGAEVDTTSSLQRFGIVVTAEPHFAVDTPSANVAFRSAPPRDREIRVESFSIETGRRDYSSITLPPQGALPPRVVQARMAYRIAELEEAATLADGEFRQARVAVDALEELLRRNMPLDLLLPYVNDSIRLSDRAARAARARRVQNELTAATRRAERLERENETMRTDIDRLTARLEEGGQRLNELQEEIQTLRGANRMLELEKEEALRQGRTAQAEIARLGDPWPPLRAALMAAAGARETAQGLTLTLSAEHFARNRDTIQASGRELLARLAGLLTFNEAPGVRVEGHTDSSGQEARNVTLSMARAEAVRNFLVQAGVPEERIVAEGLGSSRPVAATGNAEERVEIIFEPLRRP